jgi:hypothetical protein
MGLRQDHHAERFCPISGKAMLTKGQAKSLAKRKHKYGTVNMVAYKCRTCGAWHTGNRRHFA